MSQSRWFAVAVVTLCVLLPAPWSALAPPLLAAPAGQSLSCPGTISWDGDAGDGLWQSAANWSTDSLPGPSDDVCIGSFDVTLSSGTATINSIETAGSLVITLSGVLEIASTSQIGGNLTLSTTGSGGLTGAGALTILGTSGWTSGTMSGTGSTVAAGGMTLSGTASKDLDARTLVNQAAATWTGGNIRTGDGSVLDNPGSLDIQTDADMILSFTPYNSTFTNSGSITKSVGAGGAAATAISPFLESSGTITVQQGVLQLAGGGHATGSFAPSASTTLQFSGGTHDLDNGSTLAGAGLTLVSAGSVNLNAGATLNTPGELRLSGGTLSLVSGGAPTAQTFTMSGGTLTGPDAFTVNGALTWSGGTMSGSGSTVAAGGMTISGAAYKDLNARTLVNQAAATWTGGGMRTGNGSVLDNPGSLDIQTDAAMTLSFTAYNSTFTNSGSITKSVGTGGTAATDIGVHLQNSGSIDVQQGILKLSGGGTGTAGSYTAAAGQTLQFSGGTHDLDAATSINAARLLVSAGIVNVAGSYSATESSTVSNGTLNILTGASVTSAGALAISGGTASFSSGSAVSVPSLSLTGGVLAGSDTITVTGATAWSGGGMSGTGSTVTAGGMAVSGVAYKDLNARTLVNQAAATWTGGGIRTGNGAVIDNPGSFDIQTDADMTLSFTPYNATLVNSGSVTKSVGAGGAAATDISLHLQNSGSIDVQQGILKLSGGGQATGSFVPSHPPPCSFPAARTISTTN